MQQPAPNRTARGKPATLSPAVHVTLQPLRDKHAPAMLRWMKDPVISANIGLRRRPTLAATRAWIRNANRDPACCARGIFQGTRHVGNVVLDRIDRHLGTARLSIYVGAANTRSQGVGSTAIQLMAQEAFRGLDLNKIWLTVHERNARAIRVYQRLGFVIEGVLREEFLLDGQRINVLLLAILRREFTALHSRPIAP